MAKKVLVGLVTAWRLAGKPTRRSSSAVNATIEGVVFAPSNDGHVRAYASADGTVVWDFDTMRDFLKGKPKVQFKKPGSTKISIGDQRSIPDVTCATISSAKSRIENAGFTASVGQEVESNCPKGTAAGTNPGGRTIKGGYVSIEISKGKDDEKPDGPGKPKPPRRR